MYRSAVSRLGSLKILPYNLKKKCRGKLQEQRKKNAKKLEAQRNLRRWEAYLIARWREGDCRTEGHQSSGVKKTAELSKFCSGVNTRGMKETIERVLVLVIIKKCGTILGCMSNLGTARPSASAVATRSSPSTGLLGLLTGERTNSIPPMDFPLAKKSKITTFYTPKEKFAVLPNGVKIASQSSLLRNVNAKLGKLSINPHGLHAEMVHSGQVRFPKHRRGRVKGISCRGDHISFGRYALQALECAWITARQIEAGRRAVIRNARAGGKVWVRVIPDKSVTARPAETRMGRGKGAPAFMVACVKPGRVLYELGGVAENVARVAIKIAASKMPIRTRFIASE